jgi:hypothetical protein
MLKTSGRGDWRFISSLTANDGENLYAKFVGNYFLDQAKKRCYGAMARNPGRHVELSWCVNMGTYRRRNRGNSYHKTDENTQRARDYCIDIKSFCAKMNKNGGDTKLYVYPPPEKYCWGAS